MKNTAESGLAFHAEVDANNLGSQEARAYLKGVENSTVSNSSE